MKILGSCECCGILCYIFLRVERALVLCNFVIFFLCVDGALVLYYFFPRVEITLLLWKSVFFYFSLHGMHSGIIKIGVIFSCVWNTFW